MSTVPNAVVILRDDAGACYLLTRELLEQARATPEVQAEIEAALAADDTSGHDSFANILWGDYFFTILSPRGRPAGGGTPPTNATGQPSVRRPGGL